jgi:hypothetical protein
MRVSQYYITEADSSDEDDREEREFTPIPEAYTVQKHKPSLEQLIQKILKDSDNISRPSAEEFENELGVLGDYYSLGIPEMCSFKLFSIRCKVRPYELLIIAANGTDTYSLCT